MRIWQKIYVVTLLLFLAMLNAGLFLAARFIFSYNLTQEQKKAEADCYFLCQNLEHDFSILKQNRRYKENVIKLLFEGYQNYYETLGVSLSLEQAGEEREPSMRLRVRDGGRQMEVFVERGLAKPFQEYRIRYQKRLSDFEKTWQSLKRTFAVISLVMSALLCLALYVLTRRVLKPLGRLNESVAKIAAGEYGHLAADAGEGRARDEIAQLSRNVSQMSATIQRQMEDLKEENRKKQQLMDNMAHELKTPLTSIYGYAEYLRYAKTGPEEMYEGLAYIMEESRRLANMSNAMLSMRLYETGECPIGPVDIQALALHVEKILLPKLHEKKIALRKNFDSDEVLGNEELFVNLFRNLLENAVCASKEGSEIVWNAKAEGGSQVFEIIDFGIGMEQEETERITEAFYRADKARARANGGAGLGLSIVNLIVKKTGGRLMFSSAPGEGTKVTILYNFLIRV